MATRVCSYCNTTYVDTEAESIDGVYPVGPHPYETCLDKKHRQLEEALRLVEDRRSDIERLGLHIYKRDHPICP